MHVKKTDIFKSLAVAPGIYVADFETPCDFPCFSRSGHGLAARSSVCFQCGKRRYRAMLGCCERSSASRVPHRHVGGCARACLAHVGCRQAPDRGAVAVGQKSCAAPGAVVRGGRRVSFANPPPDRGKPQPASRRRSMGCPECARRAGRGAQEPRGRVGVSRRAAGRPRSSAARRIRVMLHGGKVSANVLPTTPSRRCAAPGHAPLRDESYCARP